MVTLCVMRALLIVNWALALSLYYPIITDNPSQLFCPFFLTRRKGCWEMQLGKLEYLLHP